MADLMTLLGIKPEDALKALRAQYDAGEITREQLIDAVTTAAVAVVPYLNTPAPAATKGRKK